MRKGESLLEESARHAAAAELPRRYDRMLVKVRVANATLRAMHEANARRHGQNSGGEQNGRLPQDGYGH